MIYDKRIKTKKKSVFGGRKVKEARGDGRRGFSAATVGACREAIPSPTTRSRH